MPPPGVAARSEFIVDYSLQMALLFVYIFLLKTMVFFATFGLSL